MMQHMLNAMRLQAMMQGESKVSMRLAQVSSYDADNYSAKVLLQPEGVETGWLPVASQWVGNGWGMFAPPTPGDIVAVHFQEEDIGAGIIGMRLFTDTARPLSVPAGEFWIVHSSGSLLKFHNSGAVELVSAGTLTIKGVSVLLQNAGAALKKLVNETFLQLFDTHTHTSAAPGVQTSAPATLSNASNKTSVTQAE